MMPYSSGASWGTKGAGPILLAASCSHSPARHPAHLGWFQGSASNDARLVRHVFPVSLRSVGSGGGQAHALGNHAVLDIAPQRHQEFAGEGDGHDLADAAFGAAGALLEPAGKSTVRLELEPAPHQLRDDPAHPRIAVLADPLLARRAAAVERGAGQADEGGK